MTKDEFVNRYLTIDQFKQLSSNLWTEYTHDCDNCNFMGSVKTPYANEPIVDIHVCETPHGISFIARFGSEGHEYASGDYVGVITRYFK